jgi:hypothetical protein
VLMRKIALESPLFCNFREYVVAKTIEGTSSVDFCLTARRSDRCSYRGADAKALARNQNGNPLRYSLCRNNPAIAMKSSRADERLMYRLSSPCTIEILQAVVCSRLNGINKYRFIGL